jgi:hypothetical protein
LPKEQLKFAEERVKDAGLQVFINKLFSKVLNQGPLPRKRPRQKGFGAYRYRFLPFLHGERKSRRNADTAATKHRYGRNETQYGRDKMQIDINFHFFQ